MGIDTGSNSSVLISIIIKEVGEAQMYLDTSQPLTTSLDTI